MKSSSQIWTNVRRVKIYYKDIKKRQFTVLKYKFKNISKVLFVDVVWNEMIDWVIDCIQG